MNLYAKIQDDWRTALKARESSKATALSVIRASLLNKAVDLSVREAGLDDAQTQAALRRLQKQSLDTIESLPAESDLRKKEEFELSIISTYLPKQLTPEEIRAKVDEIMLTSGIKDFSAGMKLCVSVLKNQADGKQIQVYVKEFIGRV